MEGDRRKGDITIQKKKEKVISENSHVSIQGGKGSVYLEHQISLLHLLSDTEHKTKVSK